MSPLSQEDIEERFTFHPPVDDDQAFTYKEIRRSIKSVAERLNVLIPGPSREASLAFTHLEEATFWANAAVARSWTKGGE